MTNSKYGRLIYAISSVLIVLTGIAFIISCLHIFFTGGDTPFSRERVGEYLLWLLPISIVTIFSIVGGMIYASLSGDKISDTVKRTNCEMLAAYARRINLDDLSSDAKAAVLRERYSRKALSVIAYIQSGIFFALAIVYLAMCKNFTIENLNGDVILALAGVLPLSLIAILAHFPAVSLSEKSAKLELDMLKAAVADGAPIAKAETLSENEKAKQTVLVARIVIAVVAVLFVILGVFNGGMADVLAKAIKICTECIGLG